MFLIGTELFVFSPLLPLIAADYHVSAGAAGLLVTIFALSYMLGAPLFGHVSDRIGRRRVLGWSLMVFAAANLLTALAPNLSSLLAIRLLAGASAAGISPSIYAQLGLTDDFPRHRGAALAWNNSALFLGIFLGSAIGGQAVALGNFDTSLSVSAGIALFGWFVNALVVPNRASLDIRCVTDRQ